MTEASGFLDRASELTRHGALADAFDVVQSGLREHPGDLMLRHRAVLLLARAGASQQAAQEYQAAGLDRVEDNEEILALGGRLLKDRAFLGGANRQVSGDRGN